MHRAWWAPALALAGGLAVVSPSAKADAPPRVTPAAAAARALNDIRETADDVRLDHPRHVARFDGEAVVFTPRRGGPRWTWRLDAALAGDRPLIGVALCGVRPECATPGEIRLDRGGLVERYVTRADCIEQQRGACFESPE